MEASALHAPHGARRTRSSAGTSFLRLRSDDQLVELFRSGHEDAFRVIHDRYRARLFAYTRQMLPGSRADAEDALQDVFIRAYSGLRANDRHLALRAWLYRVAHNRCVDQLRKNAPLLTDEIEATSHDVSTDPSAAVEQREDLRKLVLDVQRLPDQQRSALLLRELSGMSYQELADSLDLSVPAIKSLLVRARTGLTAAADARNTSCAEIREEIVGSHERGARPNALTRRHLSDCAACREYRESVRGVSKSLAALLPIGPAVLAAKFLGLGSVYSAAVYGGASSGSAVAAAGGAAAGGAAAGGAAAGGAAAAGSAAVGSAAAGAAAAGGAGAAAGGAAAAGSGAVAGSVVAGGVTASHVAAIVVAAAAAGGAVAVSAKSPAHAHARQPAHVAHSVLTHATDSGVSGGYAPANSVVPISPVTSAGSAATGADATSAISRLRHTGTTGAASTGQTATGASTTTSSSAATTSTSSAASTGTTTAAGTGTATGSTESVTSDDTTGTAATSTGATGTGATSTSPTFSSTTPTTSSVSQTGTAAARTDSTSASTTSGTSTTGTSGSSTTSSSSSPTS